MKQNKKHFTKDGFIGCTIEDWCDLLDLYDVNEVGRLFHDIFDVELRSLLRPYLRHRIVRGIVFGKNKKNK